VRLSGSRPPCCTPAVFGAAILLLGLVAHVAFVWLALFAVLWLAVLVPLLIAVRNARARW
jgi:hypothetical protein